MSDPSRPPHDTPAEHHYAGRALVGLQRITLLDLADDSLPNMLGQLDVTPGTYQLELRLVRIGGPASRRPLVCSEARHARPE